MNDNDSPSQSGRPETRLEFLLKKKEAGLLTEDDEIELRIRQGKVTDKPFFIDQIVVVLFVFVLAMIGYGFLNKKPDLHGQAKEICQQRVLELLRDPESARWVEGSVKDNGDGLFSVNGEVAARNGFGGMSALRPYTCEVRRKSTGSWWPARVQVY